MWKALSDEGKAQEIDMAKSKKNILDKYGLDESDYSISTPGDPSSRSKNPKKTKKKVTKKSVKRKVKKAGQKVRKAAKTTAGRAGVGAAAGSIVGPVGAVAGAVIGVVTKPKRKPRRKKNPGPTVKMSTAMGNLMLDYHRASENVEHVAASALRGERIELRYVKKARTDLKKIQGIQPNASEKEQIGELVDALDRIIKKAGAIGNPRIKRSKVDEFADQIVDGFLSEMSKKSGTPYDGSTTVGKAFTIYASERWGWDGSVTPALKKLRAKGYSPRSKISKYWPQKNPARAFSLETQVKRGRQSKAKKAARRATRASSAASSVAADSLRKRMAKINPGTYRQQVPTLSDSALDKEHKAISSLITRARRAPGAGKMVTDLTKVRGYIVAEKKARRSKGHRVAVSNPRTVSRKSGKFHSTFSPSADELRLLQKYKMMDKLDDVSAQQIERIVSRLKRQEKSELSAEEPTIMKLAQKYSRARDRYQALITTPGNSPGSIARAKKSFDDAEDAISLYAEVRNMDPKRLALFVEHAQKKQRQAVSRARTARSNPLTKVTERMSDRRFRDAISRNISAEMKAGKPQKQAVAIALNQARSDAPKKSRSLYGARPSPSRIDPDTGHVLSTRKATRKKTSKKKSSKKATTKKTPSKRNSRVKNNPNFAGWKDTSRPQDYSGHFQKTIGGKRWSAEMDYDPEEDYEYHEAFANDGGGNRVWFRYKAGDYSEPRLLKGLEGEIRKLMGLMPGTAKTMKDYRKIAMVRLANNTRRK